MENNDVLINEILKSIPRILSLEDLDNFSDTFGCFHRDYWHYKIIDFPSAWFQLATLLLSQVYSLKFKDNIYYKNDKVKLWAEAGIKFFLKCRHRDGSTDEIFPFERSFCSTAFGTLFNIRSIKLLGINKLQRDFIKSALWLESNVKNSKCANQKIAAILSIFYTAQLNNDRKLSDISHTLLEEFLNSQSKEGYFYEYNGFDFGYSTVVLSILADFHKRTNLKNIYDAAKKLTNYISNYIDGEGVCDFSSSVRKMELIYPAGIFYFGQKKLKERFFEGVKNGYICVPSWLDDRYFFVLALDYIDALCGVNNEI